MEGLAGYVATGVVSLGVGILLIYLQPKAKVMYWSPHSFLFNLTRENVVLQTDALTIQNVGRKAAESVELVLDGEPDFFQFAPEINHSTETLSNNQYIIRIPSLGQKEHVTLQLLSYTRVPQLLNLRSSAGQASPMPFQIQRVFPAWFNGVVIAMFFVGIGFSAYWLIKAVVFVSRSIGVA